MRSRTLDVIAKNNTSKQTPSPTVYNTMDLEPKNGRFLISRFDDIKLSTLNMKTPRFDTIKQSPGPGSYLEKDSLTGDAKYLLSNHKGNGTRIFNQTTRFTR